MAKVRIVYVVDDKELKETQAELKKIKKQNKEVADSFNDSDKGIKKTKGSLVDLKGVIGGLGLAALATGALVEFAKLTKEINKNRKETALLTKETGAALDNITAKIRATSKVFDKDYNEVLRAANAVSQQLGITMTESMDEINEAMTRGLDINGQYLETISEYSPFMKQAGIDFRQFNILIQKQVTEGIFSDKGIDAIKEAVISIQEMTPATVDALKAVGINTDQLIKDIESGAKTYFEVIQDIGTALEDVTDQRVRGQVLADIFRGAGEDAGNFALTLQNVGEDFGELTAEQDAFIKKQKELLELNEDLNVELVTLTKSFAGAGVALEKFLTSAAIETLRQINDVLGFIKGFSPPIEELETMAKKFNDANREVKAFASTLKELSGPELETQLGKVNIQLQAINDELDPTQHTFSLTKEEIRDANTELRVANEKIKLIEKAQEAVNKKERERLQLLEEAKLKEIAILEAKKKALTEGLTDIEGKGIDPLDLQSQIADETLSIEQKLQDDLLAIRENARVIDQEADERKRQDDIEAKEEFNEQLLDAAFAIAGQIASIQSQFAQRRIAEIDQEIQANEFARNRELELAEGNAQRELEINARFDAEKRRLQNEQLKKEKEAAVFAILINTARGVVAALTSIPPNIPLSIAVGIIGAAQAGVVLGQKVPAFAEGVLKFRGMGTTKSDSNLVKISDEESIISARNTNDYYPALKAIHNREISPDVLNNLVMNQDTRPGTVVYDYDKLANAVMNQPQSRMYFDENGFTQHLIKKGISIQKKQSKYKM